MQAGIKRQQIHIFGSVAYRLMGTKSHEIEWDFWHAISSAPEKIKALQFIRNQKATFV